jgi:hypothetical protein
MVLFAKTYRLLFIGQSHVVLPTIWGARLIIPKNSFATNRHATLMLGLVESQWKNSFEQAIAKARVFIDVGAASDGYYTLRVCKINPEIKAVALEPLRDEYRYLSTTSPSIHVQARPYPSTRRRAKTLVV